MVLSINLDDHVCIIIETICNETYKLFVKQVTSHKIEFEVHQTIQNLFPCPLKGGLML